MKILTLILILGGIAAFFTGALAQGIGAPLAGELQALGLGCVLCSFIVRP